MIQKTSGIRPFLAVVVAAMALLPTLSPAQDSSSKRSGDLVAKALPAIAAGLSLASGDTEGVVQLVKSEAATLAIVSVLKSTTHQTRPNGRDDKSFPSGHTAVAFSAAQYMQMKGGWQYGVPAYLAASYVANSRVESNEHRWRDVIAGAATGALTTYYFTDNSSGRQFGFSLTGRSAAMQLQQTFN